MNHPLRPSLFRSLFITVILIIVGITNLRAQIILSESPTTFTIEEDSFSGITIRNSFTSFNSINVQTEEGIFTEIGMASYVNSQDEGLPKLPVLRKLISIPVGAQPEIEIISYTLKEFKLSDLGITNPLIPAQPPVAKNDDSPLFVFNKEAYKQNKFYGSSPCNVEVLGYMRGTRIARVDISPVSYNPVTGIIKVYEDIHFRIKFNGGDPDATLDLVQKTSSPYFNRLNSAFANNLPLIPSREAITHYPVKMVIVSDPMFEQALQPYIDWKIKKGFNVIEAYTNNPEVGTTTTSIKNYLQNLYMNGTPEDPSPSFILFVGDVNQIPVFTTDHVTDLYYCEYTNDYFPEVYYGRFSAETVAQLQPQIDKTLMYEQYLFPDPSFLGECVLVSGVDANYAPKWGNGQLNYGTTYYFNEAHGLLSHTYLYPESQSSGSLVIQHVSDGVGFANYTAHGSASGWADPSFSISDIAGLQNGGKYPLMVGNCCQTSMYGNTCFAEELLRAPNKGAVGYIGGSNNTYWDEDYFFGVGVGPIVVNPTYESTGLGNYDRAFHDHGEPYEDWYTTMDQIIFAGNLAVTEGSPGSAEYYWEIYCLMGDPSLTIYNSGIPDEMTVTYEPVMQIAAEEFVVNAVPYAYVAISIDGVLYGTALADEAGVAVVSLEPIYNPSVADIVVTAQNKQPFVGTVMIATPGPYIMLESQAINDVNGNNNLQADYDESFSLNITLKNIGNSDAEDVNVTMSSECDYLNIRSNTENWGLIPANGQVTKELAFNLLTNEWLPDQTISPIVLNITSDTNSWVVNFNIILNSPELTVNEFIIDDSKSLIPNERLDVGETVIVKVPVTNTGHSKVFDSFIYLFTDSDGSSLNGNEINTGDINSDQTVYAEFELTLSDTLSAGSWLSLFASGNANPYSVTTKKMLPVSLLIEDFETGNLTAFDWQNNSPLPWSIKSIIANNGNFSARSGAIGSNANTQLSIEMNVPTDDVIIFARKVSSEANCDFLSFFIDGELMDSWSGQINWSNVSYPVTAGNHTFMWQYSKNAYAISGSDAAYIDDIIFPTGNNIPPESGLKVHAFSNPLSACQSQDINLFAFVSGNSEPVSYEWQPSELFEDNTIYNPVTNITSSTEFTINIHSDQKDDSDIINVELEPNSEAPVIVQQDKLLVSDIAEGNQWYNSNGPIQGANAQTYEPLNTDTYYATNSLEGCESIASNQIYVGFVEVPFIENAQDLKVYPNPISDNLNIDCFLLSGSLIDIRIVNTFGQEVKVLISSILEGGSGMYHYNFNTNDLKPGVYFLRFQAGNTTLLNKLVML